MKLIDIIEYLKNPEKLGELYRANNLNQNSEALIIYMENKLDINSRINILEIEDTEDEMVFEWGGINNFQLFPIDHAIELIKSDLNLLNPNNSDLNVAIRLVNYRLRDA